MRRSLTAALAAVLAAIAAVGFIVYYSHLPTTFRVAVGPMANDDVRLMVSALQVFARQSEPFRLKLVLTDSTKESADALDTGRADLAVVRSDLAFPRQGGTVAILRRDVVVLMAPRESGIKSLEDLRGKAVGIVRDAPGNINLLEVIVQQAGLDLGSVRAVPMRVPEITAALADGRIQAVAAIAALTSRTLTGAVEAVSARGTPVFVPIEDAEAMAQRHPFLESAELVRGIFGGAPARPADSVPTVAVAHRLVADRALSEERIAEFTKTLLAAKQSMATEIPLAIRIEAPDADRASAFPLHPGTLNYLDGEVRTFLDRYGDWFYIGIMGVGLSGSLFAGYLSLAGARARGHAVQLLRSLQGFVAVIRDTMDEDRLDDIEQQVDEIFSATIGDATTDKIDATLLIAFFLAFEQVRRAIAEQRRYIATVKPAEIAQ
jgi:TRAP transporter TAXI family solute receptor